MRVFAIKASERNGQVVGAMQVTDEDELMMTPTAARSPHAYAHLRVIGRNTQGVRLFKLDEGEKVLAVPMVLALMMFGMIARAVE